MSKPLKPRETLFVLALSSDPNANARKAAIAAGCPKRSADQRAYEYLHDPRYAHVAEAYAKARAAKEAEWRERYKVSDEKIIERLAAIAFTDVDELGSWTKKGLHVKDSDELTPQQRALVKSVDWVSTEYGDFPRVRTHDQVAALTTLAKIQGLLRERIEVKADVRITQSAQRVKALLQDLIASRAQGSPPPTNQGSS